jgi:hypothetical protein
MVMAVALVAASYLTGLVGAGLPLELLELGEVGVESSCPGRLVLAPSGSPCTHCEQRSCHVL